MPVPKRKTSKSRRDKRHANKHIKVQSFSTCTNCNEPIIPHAACPTCGFYKGNKVFATKLDKSIRRREDRHKMAVEREQSDSTSSEIKAE